MGQADRIVQRGGVGEGGRLRGGVRKGRQSIRRSFLQKVLGPVAGYSEEYELLHLVYDLAMWSTLGGTKNSAKGVPLRLALKNASFSPEYWRARHLALLPFLFRTRAPYERSFPYHAWVMDEMAKAGRGRQKLAGPETLHMAHPQGVRPRLLQRHEPPNGGEKLEGASACGRRRNGCADRRQLRLATGVSGRQAEDGDSEINFSTVYRCEDPKLRRKLSALRTAVPSAKLLSKVADRAHRAWEGSEPDAWDVLSVLRRTDYKTTMVTCTRKGALLLNHLAAKVLFEDRHQAPLAELPLDWEADPANFDKEGEPVNDVAALPTQIYTGVRIVLTKNLNKRQDFVNGMGAVVEAYDAASGCLTVETNTGKRLAICRIRERVGRRDVGFYPVRLGYASTVQKVQGQTLEHVTLWLDRACCRATGYVALSRVRRDEDYLIAGNVTPLHFIPAM